MPLLPLSWYDAIFHRTSRRSFTAEPVEEEKSAGLERLGREFRPYAGVRAVFVRESPDEVFRGIIGGYGKITGARRYAAFVGDVEQPRVGEGIGYTGEAFILEATALGLGTCWVSGFFRPDAVRHYVALDARERVFAVTPVGYAETGLTVKDRFYKTAARSRQRKSLRTIVSGRAPAPWQQRALDAARLAPSAANRQPWRFLVEETAITVLSDDSKDRRRYPKRLDCGIAMLHIELGALAAGVSGRWTPLSAPGVARFEIAESPEDSP